MTPFLDPPPLAHAIGKALLDAHARERPFFVSRCNVGACCLTRRGARVIVTGHTPDRDFPGKDTYDLRDLDTGETSQEMGYATWFVREIERPIVTRYRFELWTGTHWSHLRSIDGIGEAFRYARRWDERNFDVRITCGSVVIVELRGARVNAA